MGHEILEFLLRFVERRGDVNDAKKAREYRELMFPEPVEPAEGEGGAEVKPDAA